MNIFTWPKAIIVKRKKQKSLRKVKNRKTDTKIKAARALVHERLLYFNQFYGYRYGRVSIRAQKTRWGSCSSKANLNFNWKIILLPPELVDYLIVHELCHLKEFHHKQAFWDLVERTIPQCKKRQEALRAFRIHSGTTEPVQPEGE